MITQIYVDDIVFGGMSNQMVQHFVHQMQSEFKMSLVGELTYFLVLQVKQMEDTIFISQSKYSKNIVKKFGLENASHKRTPTATHLKLSKDENGVVVDQSLYRSMIGSLLYLTTCRSMCKISSRAQNESPDSSKKDSKVHQWHHRLWNFVLIVTIPG